MRQAGKYDGTLRFVRAHWPAIIGGYGGGILAAFLLAVVSIAQGWWAFAPPAVAIMLVLGYFVAASLWAAHEQFDRPAQQDHQILFRLGQIKPTDRFAHISLGTRLTARGLAHRLTSGHITVIDVYNPQLAPRAPLARLRLLVGAPEPDPRLSWLDGSIDLLPLPDRSVYLVTMERVLGELTEHGDRLALLREIRRVLAPGGRVVLADVARSDTNALVQGPSVLRLPNGDYWQSLFDEADFQVVEHRSLKGLVDYWRLDKARLDSARQLQFDFGL